MEKAIASETRGRYLKNLEYRVSDEFYATDHDMQEIIKMNEPKEVERRSKEREIDNQLSRINISEKEKEQRKRILMLL